MKLKDLATALGISPAMVSKLSKRGMPTASVEAAAKWRRRHLEHARTKGNRAGTAPAPEPGGRVSNPASSPQLVDARTVLQLRQVEELGLLAHDALGRGTFDTVAPMLRQAMARVPFQARAQIGLTLEVWDALTAAIPLDLQPSEQDAAAEAAGELSDDFMGVFWQQIALGEYADMGLVAPVSMAGKARTSGTGG